MASSCKELLHTSHDPFLFTSLLVTHLWKGACAEGSVCLTSLNAPDPTCWQPIASIVAAAAEMYELPFLKAGAAAAASYTCCGRVLALCLVSFSGFSSAPMVPSGARAAGPAAPA